nr:hypothetical protein 13 [Alphaproteobacteria bacterium]
MGESYEDVLTKLNWTDPYNCKDQIEYGEYGFPIRIAKQPLIDGFHTDLNSINGRSVAHSLTYRVSNIFTNRDCEIEKVEFLKFCPSNAKLIHSEVRYPIIIKDDFRDVFDEDSRLFIGPYTNERIVDYEFKGSMITFSVESNEGMTIRTSSFVENLSDRNKGIVYHSVFEKAEGSLFEPYNLCPNGEDKLVVDGKIQIPKIQNLEKVYRSTISVVREFEKIRTMYNECSSSFPNNRSLYDEYWEDFLNTNQTLYFNITNKFEQTLSKVSSVEVKGHYQSKFNKMEKLFTSLPFLFGDDEERCNKSMREKAINISELYVDVDKTKVDLDFVLNLSFE